MELQEFLDYCNSGKAISAESEIIQYSGYLTQEALKITTHPQTIPMREGCASLCGRMFYYDGETMTVRTAHYQGYDDDCAEHEQWGPVESTTVGRNHSVADAIRIWRKEWVADSVTLSLVNDCFVDYVSRRDNDERVAVMLPGRRVEAFVAEHAETGGLPLGSLYQNEYRYVDETFPYGQLTLAQIGIPERDIVRVTVDGLELLALSHNYCVEMIWDGEKIIPTEEENEG